MSLLEKLFGKGKALDQTSPSAPVTVSTDPQKAKVDGETVKCGSCGKILTVKYYDTGKHLVATPEAVQSLARCQDCGFIVCAPCAMRTATRPPQYSDGRTAFLV